jgi:hypothetical protein
VDWNVAWPVLVAIWLAVQIGRMIYEAHGRSKVLIHPPPRDSKAWGRPGAARHEFASSSPAFLELEDRSGAAESTPRA